MSRAAEQLAPAPADQALEDLRAGRTPRERLPLAAEIDLLEKGHLQHRYDGRSYSVSYGWWKRRETVRREVTRALTGVTQPRVLEIGCHKGGELIDIARELARPGLYEGVDLSLEFVRFAGRWAAVREMVGMGWGVSDAGALPYADGSFHALVATEMVEHLPHPERAIAEFARVLRPDGTAVISTVNPSSGIASIGRWVDRALGGRLRRAVTEGIDPHDHEHDHEHHDHSYEHTADFGTRDPGHVSEFPLVRWASMLRAGGFATTRIVPGAMTYGGPFYDRHRMLFAAILTAESTWQRLPGLHRFCTAGTIVARRGPA